MRALKIIMKDVNCYKTYLINLMNINSMVCTYPRPDIEKERAEVGIQEPEAEKTSSPQEGQKIEISFASSAPDLEIDLETTPCKFIVFDDYGNLIKSTADLQELEEAVLESVSEEEFEEVEPGVGTELPIV